MIKRILDWKYQVKGGIRRFKVFGISYEDLAKEENCCVGSLEDLNCKKKTFYDEREAIAYAKYLNRAIIPKHVYVLEQRI